MRPSEFFRGQDLFWWLQNGAPKKTCGMSVLSKWKELGIWNFAGCFVDSIQDVWILFSLIGQSVELEFPFFPGKVGNLLFSLTRLLTIFHIFQENLMKCLNLLNRVIMIEFYRFFINLSYEVTRFAHPCFR
jgi:hypothetical protein